MLKEGQGTIEMSHHQRFDRGQIIGMDILVPLACIAIKFGQRIAADRRPAFIIDRLPSHEINIPEAEISPTQCQFQPFFAAAHGSFSITAFLNFLLEAGVDRTQFGSTFRDAAF